MQARGHFIDRKTNEQILADKWIKRGQKEAHGKVKLTGDVSRQQDQTDPTDTLNTRFRERTP